MDDTNKTIIKGTQESTEITEKLSAGKPIKKKEKIYGRQKLRIKSQKISQLTLRKRKTAQEIK